MFTIPRKEQVSIRGYLIMLEHLPAPEMFCIVEFAKKIFCVKKFEIGRHVKLSLLK